MSENDFGELVPQGGGDPIPLRKKNLLVGRRESCDIVLRFSNVSAHHCQLENHGGYWYVRDMSSRNGTRVNGVRVTEKRLDPGDELRVAKHKYQISYSPIDLGAMGPHSDVYGVGATLYEMLTGRQVFETDNMEHLFRMVLNERPQPMRSVAPS